MTTVRRLIGEHPGLASARMIGRHGRDGGWRTPLHAVTDWPGYFPAGSEMAAWLLAAGADPDDDTGGRQPETPRHWAASTDDVDVAAVLVGADARLDTPGGSIGTAGQRSRLRLLARRSPPRHFWGTGRGPLARRHPLLRRRPDRAGRDHRHRHPPSACGGMAARPWRAQLSGLNQRRVGGRPAGRDRFPECRQVRIGTHGRWAHPQSTEVSRR